MADELTVKASLVYSDADGVEVAIQPPDYKVTLANPGISYYALSYGTTPSPVATGGISGVGFFMLRNLDPTNFVEVLSGSGGVVIGKMLPGETYGPIRRGSGLTDPYLQADTAACKVEVFLVLL